MRIVLALVASLLLSGSLLAQPDPSGPPPTLKLVANVNKEKGTIGFLLTVTKSVPVEVEREVEVNGQKMKVKATVYEFVQTQQVIDINLAQSRIITPDGKKVPIDEVWKRLKKNSVVVVSGDGNAPAQAFLRALNAETLVIIPPAPKNEFLPPPKKE